MFWLAYGEINTWGLFVYGKPIRLAYRFGVWGEDELGADPRSVKVPGGSLRITLVGPVVLRSIFPYQLNHDICFLKDRHPAIWFPITCETY